MPWPPTRQGLTVFEDAGLAMLEFEDYLDDENSLVSRFRVNSGLQVGHGTA